MYKNRVAVKAFIIHNNKFLLLERSTTVPQNPEYDIPGGGIENGESYNQALEREIAEETGLQVQIGIPLRAWNFSETNEEMLYGVTFLTQYKAGKVRLSAEHRNWQWLDFSQIHTLNLPKWIREEAILAAAALNISLTDNS